MKPHHLYQLHKSDRRRIAEVVACELAQARELAFAYLYGSVIEGDRVHDVDVGIYLLPAQGKSSQERAAELGEKLSTTLKLPVDLRILNHAPISFLYHVLRGQLLYCRDEALLTSVIENTAREYLDLAPLIRQSTKDAFAA